MPSDPPRPLRRGRPPGGTHRVAALVTLGLTAAACTTATVSKAPAAPRVLGQQAGTAAVMGQPAPAGTGQLDAVTCADPAHCWAVGTPGPSGGAGTTGAGTTGAGATGAGTTGAGTTGAGTSSVPQSPDTVIDATSDSGKTWVGQPLTLTPAPALTGISCPSAQLCMAVGLTGTGTAGVVLTTADGGSSWAQATVPTGAIVVSSVLCQGADDCTAIASDGTTFWSAHSADFGLTWQREGDLPPGFLDAGHLSCVVGAACLVTGFTATTAGHGQGAIAISTDSGLTWSAAAVPAGTGLVQGAACATISSCLAVGTTSTTVTAVVPAQGAVLTSDDGGHTWARARGTEPIDDIFGIDCPSRSICVMTGTDWTGTPTVGTGAVAHSSDGGATFTAWATEYTPLALTGVSCPTTQHCVAVGGDTVARIVLPHTTLPRPAASGSTTLPRPAEHGR